MFYYKGEHLIRSPSMIGHKKAEVTGTALGTSLALLNQDGYKLNLSRSSHQLISEMKINEPTMSDKWLDVTKLAVAGGESFVYILDINQH